MTLSPGVRLGPYEVVSPIGAGGMGEVFKARDTRLDRTVAIKILPAEFAKDERLRVRFEREAKTISQLNHPNICTLYDVGHDNGTDYLVMEYLEGETLADRLSRGPLPLEQALRYGVQIAEALARAHSAGIVHRDLKPGNIMLTKAGAKLLDFGLAMSGARRAGEASEATEQKPLTEPGVMVGTLQYMAPEQIEGHEAGPRTDIFTFGAVLYEMVTGRRAFAATSRTSLIAAIVAGQPRRMSELRPLTPATLEALVARCLEKDPDHRWQSAADLQWELARVESGTATGAADTRRTRSGRAGWIAAAIAILAAGAIGVWAIRSRPRPAVSKFTFDAPAGWFAGVDLQSGPPAVSPDGRSIVFVATDAASGRRAIWLRSVDSVEPKRLEATEEGSRPFWSPDNRSIVFFASNQLKRIEVAGGPARVICESPNGRGGTWGRSGVIVFSSTPLAGLDRIAATGGTATPLTRLDARDHETSHRWPSFLPDGDHFFYTARRVIPESSGLAIPGQRSPGLDRVYAESVQSPGRKLIFEATSNVIYSEPGYVFFVRDRALFAQKFDARRLEVSGEPVAITSHLRFHASGFGMFSVSPSTLVYQAGATESRLELLERSTVRSTAVIAAPAEYSIPRLSHDQQQILYVLPDPTTGSEDLWLFDRGRRVSRRLTDDPANDFSGVLSPDGTRLFFTSNRSGTPQIYSKPVEGGDEKLVFATGNAAFAQSLSPDGRYLLFVELTATQNDILSLSLADGRRAPFAASPSDEIQPEFSPDGRYVAFASNESGRYEVYAAPFPAASPRVQISTEGGTQPTWRGDGREIYYIGTSGRLMSVPIEPGARIKAGDPTVIATVDLRPSRTLMREYDVSPDGNTFLINSIGSAPKSSAFTVVQNWTEDIRK